MIKEKLGQRLCPIYKELWAKLKKEGWTEEDMTLFAPQWGKAYPEAEHRGLLFVGKANNGWYSCSPDDLFEADGTFKSHCTYPGIDDRDTAWYEACYETPLPGETWQGNRSAWARLLHDTSVELFNDEEHWASHLAYTNLYKVAFGDGNPSTQQQNDTAEECVEALRAELEVLSPRVAVFANENWGEWFLQQLYGEDVMAKAQCGEWVKRIEIGGMTILYMGHPQGKPVEQREELWKALRPLVSEL